MRKNCLPALLCLSVSVCPAFAQVPPEKSESTFTLSNPALEFKLWASEPLFVNPTCLDVDHMGRVWVCDSVNYRHRLHHQPPRRPQGDRIVILEDSHGTGRADKATTFYQSRETLAPLGIAVAKDPTGPGYKVFVCQSPDILLFEDKDGDGHADGPPKKFLSGFRGIDHDHGVHGILIGPDNRFYFSVGDEGVKDLPGKNGRRWSSNSTDCRAGTIWRCDLDGKNVELLAHNFRNEYEPCVDSFGTVFVSDNDDDGNQQTRICYVMPGGNYGYHPRGPGETHWHEEQPGVVPKILRTYFGSPTGICVYEGDLLPEAYRGQLLHTDAGPRHVRCYHLKPEGASYAVDREDIVNSSDTWFRPSDVCVGPDGSVFVADWYDPGVGGHGMGDVTRGRIFRLAPKVAKPLATSVDLTSPDGVRAALASPALSVRAMAMAKLTELGSPKVEEILEPAIRQTDNFLLRARAYWQLGRLGCLKGQAERVLDLLKEGDYRFNLLGLRLAKDYLGHEVLSRALTEAARHSNPAVRREALLALRDVDADRAKPLIVEMAKRYQGNDRFYLEALGIAVGQNPARRETILADFDKQFPTWDAKTADLVWELRPPRVVPLLEKQLQAGSLPAEQMGRVIDILAATGGPEAGKVVLRTIGTASSREARDAQLKSLRQLLPNRWRSLRNSPELERAIDHLLSHPDTREAGLILIAAAEKGDRGARVAAIARDAKEAEGVRAVAVQTLAVLPGQQPLEALSEFAHSRNAIVRAEAVQGLGRKPQSEALAVLKDLALKSPDVALRQSAAAALAGSRAGTIWLLDVQSKKQLPDELKSEVARLVRNSPYQDLRNRALQAFPPPGRLDPNKLPAIGSLARRKGDGDRGRQLLAASANNDMQCLKCHTVRGVGGKVGPDLSVIGKKASRENLFESILLPSKAIADQYINWTIETHAGLALNGLLVEETGEHLTLRDANGKDTRIAKREIESRAKSPNSLMPSDLLAYMTEDDVVDLVEYLFSLKTPVLTPEVWHVVGPFDGSNGDACMDQDFPPEKGIDLKASFAGKNGTIRWRTVKPDASGYVDLQAFFAPDSAAIVSYLYQQVESPADQDATLLLGTDDCAKLWLNGRQVYINTQHRAAAPEQETVKVRIHKGPNKLLLKINNGDGPHGFYLSVVTDQELTVAKTE